MEYIRYSYNSYNKRGKYNTRSIGEEGEYRVINHLVDLGYRILYHSFNLSHKAEIDILSYNTDTLVVTEVKTLKSSNWEISDISKWVNKRKKDKIRETTTYFIAKSVIPYANVRFDVAFVTNKTIFYYKGVSF